jgi:uncharacterized protein
VRAGGAHLRAAFLGLSLGAVLARIGFHDYREVHRMFVFADRRLFYTFVAAVAFSALGFLLIGGARARRAFHRGIVPGSVLFGLGWALTGACPAIALVQLGHGYLPAVATAAGILFGTFLYRVVHRRWFRWDPGSCDGE